MQCHYSQNACVLLLATRMLPPCQVVVLLKWLVQEANCSCIENDLLGKVILLEYMWMLPLQYYVFRQDVHNVNVTFTSPAGIMQ